MRLRLLLTTLLVTVSLSADVTLPAILTDHMVLQRGLPIHLWGKATPGEEVTATFRTATQATKADPLGKWSLYLSPSDAGGPFPLTIKGNNTISFNDVLVGDVWVASGQSNMEFQMRQIDNADAEIAAANYPKIRRVKVGRKPADYPLDDVTAEPSSHRRRPGTRPHNRKLGPCHGGLPRPPRWLRTTARPLERGCIKSKGRRPARPTEQTWCPKPQSRWPLDARRSLQRHDRTPRPLSH